MLFKGAAVTSALWRRTSLCQVRLLLPPRPRPRPRRPPAFQSQRTPVALAASVLPVARSGESGAKATGVSRTCLRFLNESEQGQRVN